MQHPRLVCHYPRGNVVRASGLRAHDGCYIVTVRCSTSDRLSLWSSRPRRPNMSGKLPPLHGISGADHGAYCIISTATWACITGFVVTIRFTLAWHHKLKVGWDDISFAIAAVSAWRNIQPIESVLRRGKPQTGVCHCESGSLPCSCGCWSGKAH